MKAPDYPVFPDPNEKEMPYFPEIGTSAEEFPVPVSAKECDYTCQLEKTFSNYDVEGTSDIDSVEGPGPSDHSLNSNHISGNYDVEGTSDIDSVKGPGPSDHSLNSNHISGNYDVEGTSDMYSVRGPGYSDQGLNSNHISVGTTAEESPVPVSAKECDYACQLETALSDDDIESASENNYEEGHGSSENSLDSNYISAIPKEEPFDCADHGTVAEYLACTIGNLKCCKQDCSPFA